MAIDSAGNVYVTGTRLYGRQVCDEDIGCYDYIFPDIITIKYNSTGHQIWLNRFSSSVPGDQTTPVDIDVSKNGDIFIAANLTQYHSTKDELWDNSLLIQTINKNGKTTGSQIERSTLVDAACLDNDENLLIAGAFPQNGVNLFGTYKAAILKFTKNRDLLWSATYNNNTRSCELSYIACDSLNNIYVNGKTDTFSLNDHDIYQRNITIKYNSAGQQRWAIQQGNSGFAHFIADTKGNTFLTASTVSGSINYSHQAIMKYNSRGER